MATPITPDTKDWTWVLERPCPECGFDPATVADTATYDDPTTAPVGIEAVFLAGELAVDGGRPVRPSLGRVLRPEVSGRRPPRRS